MKVNELGKYKLKKAEFLAEDEACEAEFWHIDLIGNI